MIAPKARLSTSVTPNWRVKPTEAIASTDAVTRPNPMEARNRLTVRPLPGGEMVRRRALAGAPVPARDVWWYGSRLDGPQLGGRDVADDVHLAGWAVGVDLEDAGRIVEAVEVGRATWSLVPDRLARLQRGGALDVRVAHRGAGHAIPDLDDVRPVHTRARALRHQHRQRRQVDAVVKVDTAGSAQVGGEVPAGAGHLALLGQQRRLERRVSGTARLHHQVVGVEAGRERARADRRGRRLEERRRDRRRGGDDRDALAPVELLDLREQSRVGGTECLGHDRLRVRLDDRLGLGTERGGLEVERLVGGDGYPRLLERGDG